MAVVEFQMESIDLLFCLTKWLFHNSTKEHHGILNGSRLWGPCTMYIPDNTLRSMGCTEPAPAVYPTVCTIGGPKALHTSATCED